MNHYYTLFKLGLFAAGMVISIYTLCKPSCPFTEQDSPADCVKAYKRLNRRHSLVMACLFFYLVLNEAHRMFPDIEWLQ